MITETDVEGHGQILKNIVKSYDKFKSEYSKINCNFKKSQLWYNEAFRIGRGNSSLVKRETFNEEELNNEKIIRSWTAGDLIHNGEMKSRNEINTEYDTNIGLESYRKLKVCTETSIKRYGKNDLESKSITEFFEGFKKGSKKIRNVLVKRFGLKNEGAFRQANTYFNVLDVEKPVNSKIKILYSLWNCSFIPSL